MSDSNSWGGEAPVGASTRWYVLVAVPLLVVAVILTLVLGLVGLGWLWALIIGLVVAALVGLGLWFFTDTLVANLVGATETSSLHPRLSNLSEELCARSGVTEPRLLMVNDDAPNAVAFGRSRSSASIAVTNGLVNQMSVVEVEGVLARELGRIRSGEVVWDTLGVSMVRLPLAPFGSLGRAAVDWARGGDHDVRSDLEGVSITRYPPGLMAALERMNATGAARPGAGITEHLWTSGPDRQRGAVGEWSLDERIAVLQEL